MEVIRSIQWNELDHEPQIRDALRNLVGDLETYGKAPPRSFAAPEETGSKATQTTGEPVLEAPVLEAPVLEVPVTRESGATSDDSRPRLSSILLYGSLLEPQFKSSSSDVNLLVVCTGINLEFLDYLGAAARQWTGSRPLAWSIFSTGEIVHAADVFPSRFLSIKDNYRILYGEDPFGSLTIERANLRLRIEQDLRETQMRIRCSRFPEMRERTGGASPYRLALHEVLDHELTAILHTMRSILRHEGVHVPPTPSAVLSRVEQELGREFGYMDRILDHRAEWASVESDEVAALFDGLLESLDQLVEAVDRL